MNLLQNKKIIIYAVVCIIIIVAISTSSWSISVDKDFEQTNGLWNFCISGKSMQSCNSYPTNISDINLQFIRGLCILGLLLIIVGIILFITIPNGKYNIILFILGSVFSIVANVLWTQNNRYGTNNYTFSLGYSWYLNLIASVISIISAVLIQFKILN